MPGGRFCTVDPAVEVVAGFLAYHGLKRGDGGARFDKRRKPPRSSPAARCANLGPQLAASRLQPVVERRQRRKARDRLPEAVTSILNVLLDLPLFPARGRIAECGLEQEMADHGGEAGVDPALFAAPDLVDRRAHVDMSQCVPPPPKIQRARLILSKGSETKNIEPIPSRLFTLMIPPCNSTTTFARYRPTPVPVTPDTLLAR